MNSCYRNGTQDRPETQTKENAMLQRSFVFDSVSGFLEIDESLLTSDVSTGEENTINMLAHISKCISIENEESKLQTESHLTAAATGSMSPRTKTHSLKHGKSRLAVAAKSKQLIKSKRRRSKMGCWTCRLRHKACPEDHDPCSACMRLGLECDWSSARPVYMTDPQIASTKLKEIKTTTDKVRKRFCGIRR